MLNCFVSGNVDEVLAVGNDLLNAVETAKESIIASGDGTDVNIKHKDGKIIITYKPSGIRSSVEETEESTEETKDFDLEKHTVSMKELEELCNSDDISSIVFD